MKVIEPRELLLKSSNVSVNIEDEWLDTTIYGLGDIVQVTTATPHKVYKSLRGNNTNRPPADSLEPVQETSTSVSSVEIGTGVKTFATQTGLGFSSGMIVEITKTTTPKTVSMDAEVTSYDSGTGVLEVSVYSVRGSGTHMDWTINSEDEIGFWEETGSTNQYAMFDEYINTQTERLEEIYVTLDVTRVDYVSLFGLQGSLVELFLWDETETTLLWSGETDLVYGAAVIAGISDWYEYFFGEYSAREDASLELGAITYAGVLGIRITAEVGETAKCGNVIVGRAFAIGTTVYETSVGMIDFSNTETDDIGRTKVELGYSAKRNEIQVRIENYKLDAIYKLLSRLRGVPTAWSANNPGTAFESFVIFGICKDFNITHAGEIRSWCELEIEGFT